MTTAFFNTYPNPFYKKKAPTEVQVFDFFEIQSMQEFADPRGGTNVEPYHGEPDAEAVGPVFYGIYGHLKNVGVIHFADRESVEEAELLLKQMGVIAWRNPWEEDPEYPVENWKYEVANDDTRIGYRDWVESQRENSKEP